MVKRVVRAVKQIPWWITHPFYALALVVIFAYSFFRIAVGEKEAHIFITEFFRTFIGDVLEGVEDIEQ